MVKRMYGGRRTRRRTMRGGRKTRRTMYGGRKRTKRMRGGRRTKRPRRTSRPRRTMMSGGEITGGVKIINDSDKLIKVQAGFVNTDSGNGTVEQTNFEASEGAFLNSAKPVPAPNPDGSGGVFGVDQGLNEPPEGKDRGLKITLPNNEEFVINRGPGGRHAVHVKGTNGAYTIEVAEITGGDLPSNDKSTIISQCGDFKQVYTPSSV